MFHATIDLADVQDFRGRLHGELICMGDEGYDPTNFFQLNQNIKPAAR